MISENERSKLKRNARIQAVVLAVMGVAFIAVNSIVAQVFGLFLFGLALVFAIKGPQLGERFVVQQRARLEALREEKKGIVFVWIVALLTWGIMAIAYFSLSMVVYMVLDNAEAFIPWESAPPWADQYMQTITLTRNVCGWFLIIMTVGIIGWALINSARRTNDSGVVY